MLRPVTHDEAAGLLSGYAAATLDLADAARVRAHLASGCADCLRELFGRPVGLPRPMPPVGLPRPVPPGHVSPPRTRRTLALAVALAGAVAATGLAAWTAHELQRRETRAARQSARLAARVSRLALKRERLAARPPQTDDRGPRGTGGERPEAPAARADAAGRSGPEAAPERREVAPAERAAPTDAERSAPHIAYSPDVLSIQVANAPLTAVLEAIAHQSGAAIRGEARARGVSASFEDVPLPDALVRLLGEQNFTLRYDSDGKLRTIDLLGEPLPLAAAQTTRTDASNPDKSAGRHRHRGVQFSRETLPDGQVLVSVAGTDTGGATKGSARLGSLSEQGGMTQEVANQEWPAPDEFDRKLRRRFLDMLAHMDEAALADYFATPDGQRTQALLQEFAANHPGGHSQDKATGILDKIPGQASQAPQDPAPRPK